MARYDREILTLAVPALGALAAGPVYTLVDTAIVGHLGARPLAALALAGTVISGAVSVADFLSYGTTAQISRLIAAGERARAEAVAAQALWLSLATGIVAALALLVFASPLLALIGHGAGVHRQAQLYLLIVLPGVPAQLVALAGEGCLRGLGDLRSPLRILIIANAVNVVLEVWFVYGLHLGLAGSALGTLIAQLGMGLAFARRMLRIAGTRAATRSGADAAAAAHRRTPHDPNGRAARRVHALLRARGENGNGIARRPPGGIRAVPVPRPRAGFDRDRRSDPDRTAARRR